MQNNYIIKNLFNEDQVSYIKNNISSISDDNYVVESSLGRKLTGLFFDSSINNFVLNIAKEISGLDLVVSDFGYSTYSSKYGTPNLTPHIDANATDLVIDYQVDGNIEWPIYVEGNEFILKNNDAVFFYGTSQAHWRSIKKFNENDFISVIFFHFVKKDSWSLLGQTNPLQDELYDLKIKTQEKWKKQYMEGI
jgi:hypothetical protein